MYKNILLPTDGSALSLVAIDNGLQFAKAVGAKVTGFYVMLEREPESFEDYAPVQVKAPKLDEVAKQEADQYLKVIADKARAMGVACETRSTKHASPHQAIITMATQTGCDLIVMASHGRKGITGELVGSETARVITNCKIPVLVYR
ncbi:MAG: universal stress protein [Betaproteobacteria bacterium]|nr:universal stress protein [Betaproteobacteria bacterium]